MLCWSPTFPTGAAPGSQPNWGTGGTSQSLFPTQDWKAEHIWQAEAGETECLPLERLSGLTQERIFFLSLEIFNQQHSKLFIY